MGVSDKWGEEMKDGLIRRSDAIEVLACEMYAEAQSQGYEVDSIEDFMPEAKAWLNDAPSADRPQGHYIKGRNGEWYCSNCKRIDDKYSVANFCWHCGADMRGDKR